MINGWNSHYYVKPVIEGDFDYYKITFPTTKTTTKTTSKTTYKKYDVHREQEVKNILAHNAHLTAQEIAQQLNLSVEGVRYHIKNLKKKGLLQRKGGKKIGTWEVR
jgi:predicted HTH transcriptional regulator